ncbi:MAG: hypothetical protein ACE5HB_08170 [Terriglobia bacterium]
MTDDELRRRAADYRRNMLEGGEGYNPYEVAITDQERQNDAARTRAGRMDEIRRRLEVINGPRANQMGLHDDAEIARLRTELSQLKAELEAEFLAD